MRRGRKKQLDDADNANAPLRFVYAIPHNEPSAAAAAAEQLVQMDVMGVDATASLVFEDDLMSSPDPLNESVTDSALVKSAANTATNTITTTRRRTGALSPLRQMQQPPSTRRITRSALGHLASSALAPPYSSLASATSARTGALNSPRKQTFELDVGSEISPQRILVTVETEDSVRDMDSTMMSGDAHISPAKKRVSRRLFKSPSRPLGTTSTSDNMARTVSPKRTRALRYGEVVTTTVPLRGLTDDEGDGDGDGDGDAGAMTAGGTTPRKRGRPPKSGTPLKPAATSTAKRRKAPIRKTPGRLRQQERVLAGSDTLTSDISVGDSQASATPRPPSSKPGRPPKRKLASSPGKDGSVPGPSPRKRGRPRKDAAEPGLSEELAPVDDGQEPVADIASDNVSMASASMDDRISVAGSENSAASELQPDDDIAMDQGHESEEDIWLANLSAPPTPAVGRGWKKVPSPGAHLPVELPLVARPPTASNIPSDELRRFSAAPSTEPVLPSGAAESQFDPDHISGAPENDGDFYGYAASHTSDSQSQISDQNPSLEVRSEREDTAAGEDFTEISISMLPSMNPKSSIRVPDAEEQEFGEATSLIINRTLEELRRSQMEKGAVDQSAGVVEQETAETANAQPDGEEAGPNRHEHDREEQDQQQLPVADQTSLKDGRDSHISQSKSQHSWWSSPRRQKGRASLGKQLAIKNLKAKEDAPSQAGGPSSGGVGHEESQDTNMYEDSFSEIPEAVLDAATPRPSRQRLAVMEEEGEVDAVPETEADSLGDAQPMSDVRPSLDSSRLPSPGSRRLIVDTQSNPSSQASSLLTPDETPSADSQANDDHGHEREAAAAAATTATATADSRISINIMPSAATNASTDLPTSGPAFEGGMGSSPPAFNTGLLQPGGRHHSTSVFRHSRTRSMETPLDQSSSLAPREPPAAMSTALTSSDNDKAPHTAPPFHSELPTQPRPGLSPIVRAGRALQLVTSDPPSPPGRESVLGSPFHGSNYSPGRSPLVASFLLGHTAQTDERPSAAVLGTAGTLMSAAAGSLNPPQPASLRPRSRSQSREPTLKSPATQHPEGARLDLLGPPQRNSITPQQGQKAISPDPIAIASTALHSDDVFAPRPAADGSLSERDSTFRISGVFADGRLSVSGPQSVSSGGSALSAAGSAEEDHSEDDITSPPLTKRHAHVAHVDAEMGTDEEDLDGGEQQHMDEVGNADENASDEVDFVHEHVAEEPEEPQRNESEDEDDIWAVEAARSNPKPAGTHKPKEPEVSALPSQRPKLPSPWRPAAKGLQRVGNARRLLMKHSEPDELSLLAQERDALGSSNKDPSMMQQRNRKKVDISTFFSSPAMLPDADQPGFGLLSKALGRRTENIPPKQPEQLRQEQQQHQPDSFLPGQPRTFAVPWSSARAAGPETDPASTDPAATIDDPTSPLQDVVNIPSTFQPQRRVWFPARKEPGQATIPEKNSRLEPLDNSGRPKRADLFSPVRRPQQQQQQQQQQQKASFEMGAAAVAAPTPSIERDHHNLQEPSAQTKSALPQQGVFSSVAQKRDFTPRARHEPNTLFSTGLASSRHAAARTVNNAQSDDHLPPSATKPPVLFNPSQSMRAYPVQPQENDFFEDYRQVQDDSSPGSAAVAAIAANIDGGHDDEDYGAYEEEDYEEEYEEGEEEGEEEEAEEDVQMLDSEEQQPEQGGQPSAESRLAPCSVPGRAASPGKSCLRSPLKPKTPGRVVEFASSVLSPAEQARLRAARRRSRSRSDSLSSVGSNPSSARNGEDAAGAASDDNTNRVVGRGVSFGQEHADDGAITSRSSNRSKFAAGGAGRKEQTGCGAGEVEEVAAFRTESRRREEEEPRRQPQEQAPGKTGGGFLGLLSSLAPAALTYPFSSAKSTTTGSSAAAGGRSAASAATDVSSSASIAPKPVTVAKAARANTEPDRTTAALPQQPSMHQQQPRQRNPLRPSPSAKRRAATPEWTRVHWLKLDELLQARRRGPVPFQTLLQKYARRYASSSSSSASVTATAPSTSASASALLASIFRFDLTSRTCLEPQTSFFTDANSIAARLVGRTLSAQGRALVLERWHLEVVAAFRALLLLAAMVGDSGSGGGGAAAASSSSSSSNHRKEMDENENENDDTRRWRAWDDEDVARRLFALMVGEERRRLGLVPKRRAR